MEPSQIFFGDIVMQALRRIVLPFLFFAQLSLGGFAQSDAGRSLPEKGALAITQAFDEPISVIPDGAGGFYVACRTQNRVYRVAADGKLSPIAGTGFAGFGGDGGPATSARLYNPGGLAVDKSGNLFIIDNGNGRVRKVTPDGIISTIAGNGIGLPGGVGSSGDGGPATSARLGAPSRIVVDSSGNLFISDSANFRVRKITLDGIIGTIAGGSPLGNNGGDGGPATSVLLAMPGGLALDSEGNLFIAEWSNQRVRKVNKDGIISTVAGKGTRGFSGDGGPAASAEFSGPGGLAFDSAGNLFIADVINNRIRKVTPDGIIRTVVGNGTKGFSGDGGPATSAELSGAGGLAFDTSGNLFIADQGNNRVRKVTPDGIIHTVAGNGTSAALPRNGLAGVRIRGRVIGIPPDAPAGLFYVELSLSNSHPPVPVRADGTFEFNDVFSGRIMLRTTMIRTKSTIINVEDKDIEGIELVPQSPTLFGQVTIEGGGRLPSSRNLVDPILGLEARGNKESDVSHQFMRSDGVFGFPPLSEDEYEVRVTLVPEGYFVKAISYGGVDLLHTQTRVKLSAGATTSFLKIKLARGFDPNEAERPKPATAQIANDAGDAMLVVSQRGHVMLSFEGSLTFFKVTSTDGTQVSREKRLGGEWCFDSPFNFPGSRGFQCEPAGPDGNDSLAIQLPAGAYEITGYSRPCDANCGNLDAPTDQCKALFALKPGETLFAERIMERRPCTMAISSRAF
jgi:sugar lactone lactonase YvrE